MSAAWAASAPSPSLLISQHITQRLYLTPHTSSHTSRITHHASHITHHTSHDNIHPTPPPIPHHIDSLPSYMYMYSILHVAILHVLPSYMYCSKLAEQQEPPPAGSKLQQVSRYR